MVRNVNVNANSDEFKMLMIETVNLWNDIHKWEVSNGVSNPTFVRPTKIQGPEVYKQYGLYYSRIKSSITHITDMHELISINRYYKCTLNKYMLKKLA